MEILEPKVEFIKGTINVRFLEDWNFKLEECPPIIIPKGFVTDFASVPRPLWPIASPMGLLRYGALPHDFGYQHGYLLTPNPGLYTPDQATLDFMGDDVDRFKEKGVTPVYIGESRKFFDKMLVTLTVEATGARLRASGAYVMVRLGGWRSWMRYRKYGPAAYNKNSLNLPGVIKK